MNQLAHVLRKVGKQIGFRAALIAILTVMLALLAAVLAPLILYDLSIKIGADAVDDILTILASSMLAVTTFSMTAMVTLAAGHRLAHCLLRKPPPPRKARASAWTGRYRSTSCWRTF
ncbi:DUF2254 family protein [Sphingomonas astaxanthinifaciens]|uniref:ABC transmembrane type-1 domain-containing protein n=1 Tax=Sphingomonas astaxanthinifaciens DSM 22298 TaxID=1123267 RepID=A0ABQ5Z3U1_9SPHN|nr:DUF2254 family protein [Sphingomonas astaxanthinifaciens]GLR46686.1 hypothetical protein GCM10007925_03970 [Sphingomonas astaxanthinifaciens DSM 22298]